jgi:cobalt/nickel transport system permease protein
LRRLGAATSISLLLLIWMPFFGEGSHDTVSIGPLTLSLDGLLRLITLISKLIAMVSLVLILLATTPWPSLLKAARSLGCPKWLVLLMLVMHRYVYLVIEEFSRLRIALRVRGFRNRISLHSYHTIGQVCGTLLVRSHDRSERVAQAMRCRGYDGEYRALADFGTRWSDGALFALVVGCTGALLIWNFVS